MRFEQNTIGKCLDNRCLPNKPGVLTKILLVCLILSGWLGSAFAQGYSLGPPPTFPESKTGLQVPNEERTFETFRFFVLGPLAVNPQSRAASQTFFNTSYLAANQPINWTGDNSSCSEGTTSLTFRDAVLLRLNYFRAMAGVPAQVTFFDTYSAKSQKAALMMSVNGDLQHYPPSTWHCYTAEGAEAAGHSNLALGVNGRDAIDLYIHDPGNDNGFAGHRRWIFYPQTQNMGTGDVPVNTGNAPANSLWVIDANFGGPRPSTREEFVAWPPPGYVPYQVVYPRWSFSYPGADFSSATVIMMQRGLNVPVTLGPVSDGYGDNTLVWAPQGINFANKIIDSGSWPVLVEAWPVPVRDTKYQVTINNVMIAGTSRSFTYSVTIFDPATPAPKNFMSPILKLLLN